MGQAHYLTIRCPLGCEAWLQPTTIERHQGRCRGRQWVDELPDHAVIPFPLAPVLASVLPPGVVEDRNPEVRRSRRHEVALDFRLGRQMHSPIEGVRARRWLHVATRAIETKGIQAVRQALTLDGFLELEAELVPAGDATECPDCGEFVTRRGIGRHQATSVVCRWRRAVAEVEQAWESGWRDPFNVDGAPLTWAALSSRVRWRSRMLTVPYPRWTAVLLMGDSPVHSSADPACESGSAPPPGGRRPSSLTSRSSPKVRS
jgi:hypothetical protein